MARLLRALSRGGRAHAARSPSAAASASTSSPTSIRTSATIRRSPRRQTLERLAWEGAAARYPEGVPESVAAQLRHELRLIDELDYAPYFLTVHSIVRFARSRGHPLPGPRHRRPIPPSATCSASPRSIPVRNDLLFERFVSEERREPPDIDVDFEHERREIVIQWVFDTYGRDRAALCVDRDPLSRHAARCATSARRSACPRT